MLKQAVLTLSILVMLPGVCIADDIDKQEAIRIKSGEWMEMTRQVEKLKAQKKWDEAEAIIRKVMRERQELHLDLSSEKSSLGRLFSAAGKTADAERMFKEEITDRESPDGIESYILVPVLNQYADFLRAHGRSKEALPLQMRATAIEADVNKPPTKQISAITNYANLSSADKYDKLCELGEKYLKIDNPTKAVFAFTEAIKLNAKSAKAFKLRSQANYEIEKLQPALSDLNVALRIDSKDAASLFDRGRLYQSLSKPTRALQDFDASIALRSSDLETLGYRAKQLAGLGKIDKAIVDYTSVLTTAPRTHWAWVQRALLYRDNKKDFVSALKDIDKAIALAPKNTEDWELRAETLVKAKRLKEATEDATRMIELEPQSLNGYMVRSRIYKALEGSKSKHAAADLATIDKLRAAPH